MCYKYKEKTGEALKKEAKALGLSEENWYNKEQPKDGSFREAAIQARVRDTKRARRESRLWILAIVSAVASVISAISACVAVLYDKICK